MQLEDCVHTLGWHLKRRHGRRVRKLALDAGFTCPNRDGTLGRGGCSFCSVAAFSEEAASADIATQLGARRAEITRAERFIAYFQAYTSSYAEVAVLRRLYAEATAHEDVVGLAVGTRPDCLPDAVLALLAEHQARGLEVWVELGLQSAHDATLARIHRGHGWAAYADAVARCQARGVPVCTHLILGLPDETPAMAHQTLARVLDAGVQGLKLHPLMVVRGSRMAGQWRRGEVMPPALEDYVGLAGELVRATPPEVVFHRLSATARPPTLLAPDWCQTGWPALQALRADLLRHGPQGSACGRRASASPWRATVGDREVVPC